MHQKRNHLGDILLIIGVFLLAFWFLPIVPVSKDGAGETLSKTIFVTGGGWILVNF